MRALPTMAVMGASVRAGVGDREKQKVRLIKGTIRCQFSVAKVGVAVRELVVSVPPGRGLLSAAPN